jgi:hypothetical protein
LGHPFYCLGMRPEEELLLDEEEEEDLAQEPTEVVLDPKTKEFVKWLIDSIWVFILAFSNMDLFPYEEELGKRIVETIVLNEGEEITGLFSRQSGKTETVADTIAGLMVLLPKLALMFPDFIDPKIGEPYLEKFKNGLMVGTFAPVEDQAETLFSRLVSRLTSDHAMEMMEDPELDDAPQGGGRLIKLKKSGSFCRMQTANPRAKIESKSYHVIIIDEAQGADAFTVSKSISPMGAFYNASTIKLGTPDIVKGDFYHSIQYNKRRQTKGSRKYHFEYDWKTCARFNPNYRTYVIKQARKIGEDSDEFRLAFKLEWLLERGMFITQDAFEDLGDKSMGLVPMWYKSPVVVGIDPARKVDSTVVTVVWVDWDHPDEFGYFDHRILNWLEIHGEDWEEQYFQICTFLQNYRVLAVGVDAQGMGGPVASRLQRLLPQMLGYEIEVQALPSNTPDQSERWKHLMQLIQRKKIGWPAHAKTRRTKKWKRFQQQMQDLEKIYQGAHMLAQAPDEREAHDDYADSLAIACVLTKDMVMPGVEETNSPFYERTR